jgi:transcriptional regulator with XRE-family HTH domain
MTEPNLWTSGKCPSCGGAAKVLNGQWFRWFRLQRKESLREVARRGELSAAFVSDFELGRRNWSPRLAKAYSIRAAFLKGAGVEPL